MKEQTLKRSFKAERPIIRAFASWCLLNLIIMAVVTVPGESNFTLLSFAQNIPVALYICLFASAFAVLTLLYRFFGRFVYTDEWLLLISLTGLMFYAASVVQSTYFALFLLVLLAAVLYYLICSRRLNIPFALIGKRLFSGRRKTCEKIIAICALSLFGVLFALFAGAIGVLRYKTFASPNFDFGIFVNMFHNMKNTLLPTVTCERDAFLSHFSVHVSPIYYLLLPFCYIFPIPYVLQVGQAVILASGVVPLSLICRKYQLKNIQSVLLCLSYVLLPALCGGTFYDMHENCFLTPLLLWMFFFSETERKIPMYVFAVLTLCVKEDAAVYVAFFGLYLLLTKKKKEKIHGAVLFAVSCIWFATAVTLLNRFGDGAMSNRYDEYIYANGGLISMIKTCIYNPMYVFSMISTEGQGNEIITSKLLYILQMLAPLGFIPFISKKKISRYILVFPMILMNLMPLYQYQYDIRFQYNFGVTAFLIYLTVMNIADMKPIGKRFAVSFCALSSALMFTVICIPVFRYYADLYRDNRDGFSKIEEVLRGTDNDGSVTASTFYLRIWRFGMRYMKLNITILTRKRQC